MPAFTSRSVERPWGQMRVWESGAGPPILAVHGLGGSGRYWQGLADRLGGRWSIVAPDLPGFGRSSHPGPGVDRAFLLRELEAVAPPGPLVVVGHSLGGILAALWVGAHAERTRGLAIAASPYPSGTGLDPRSRADLRPSLVRRAVSGGVRVIWPIIALPAGLLRGYPPQVVADFGRQSVQGRAWTMWALLSDPAAPGAVAQGVRLPQDLPVILVFAADDRTVRPASVARWRAQIPQARFRSVPSGGHQFLLRTGFEPIRGWLGELPSVP